MILSNQEIKSLVEEIYPTIFVDNCIPQSLLCGQIFHESSNNTLAFANDRNGGSYGLMQIDKDVITELGFPIDTDLNDPKLNITVGFTFMKLLYNGEFHNEAINNLSDKTMKLAMSLVCYNCGYGNFNLLYDNHLQSNYTDSWNNNMQNNISLIENWYSCLAYPVAVITQANINYGFAVDDYIENSYLGQVPLFHLQ